MSNQEAWQHFALSKNLAFYRARLKDHISKSEKEEVLGKIRGLEKELGLKSEPYNKHGIDVT
jgi:hypothetical protein